MPTPGKEHELLKSDVGTWKAELTTWMGPAGLMDEPYTVSCKETNRMLGDFWVISNFEGNFGGMPFKGIGQIGYDTNKKKYVGTWIDSMSTNVTMMSGDYDAESKTLSFDTIGMGMDGKPMKGKNVVVYDSEDQRTMTMHSMLPGATEMAKTMEIVYTREKE